MKSLVVHVYIITIVQNLHSRVRKDISDFLFFSFFRKNKITPELCLTRLSPSSSFHNETKPRLPNSHLTTFTTGPHQTSDSSFGVNVVEANEDKSFCQSILAKVAAFTIFPKKIMNALSRKGRSRSKREPEKPILPTHCPPQPREPFVNVGLHRWERQRQEWTTKDPDYVPKRAPRPPPSELDADAEELYAALLTQNYQPLPRRVPLGELVSVLQEVRDLVP